jgi:hypothetical protein
MSDRPAKKATAKKAVAKKTAAPATKKATAKKAAAPAAKKAVAKKAAPRPSRKRTPTPQVSGQKADAPTGITFGGGGGPKNAAISAGQVESTVQRLLTMPQWSGPAGDGDLYQPQNRTYPKGWEPGINYQPANGDGMELTTDAVLTQITKDDKSNWAEVLGELANHVPEGWTLELREAKYDPNAWTRDPESTIGEGGQIVKSQAVTRPTWRYKFVARQVPASIPIDDLVRDVRKRKPIVKRIPKPEGRAFVVPVGDLQLGKIDGGGTELIVDRFLTKTDLAASRFKELHLIGNEIDTIYLPWLGDCIEGFNSQGGKLIWRSELPLTDTVKLLREMMRYQIDTFASLGARIIVPSVPGNHDEAERHGGKGPATTYTDSWALDAARAVQEAMSYNPERYGHVSFVYPKSDELTITLDMGGTTVTLAHGHQFRGGPTGPHKWWANQAHGCQEPGDSTLLLGAHLHHLRVEQPGAKTFIQLPALDGGSTWWRHATGADAPAGMVTLIVGNGGWSDLVIL